MNFYANRQNEVKKREVGIHINVDEWILVMQTFYLILVSFKYIYIC